VVSTDGSRSDFSYLKCMENFVRKNFTEDVVSFCTKYLRPRRRQTPAGDEGTVPDTAAEAPRSTAAEAGQGTPAPAETEATPVTTPPPETPASTVVVPQEISMGGDGILDKGPDQTPVSPAEPPHEPSNPESWADAGILGKEPDL
jgi:hypothetical protein